MAEILKDSGSREAYSSGAVRDRKEYKGRFDLLPWVAIRQLALHCEFGAIKYGERNCEKGMPVSSLLDSAVRHIGDFFEGKKDEPHLVSAFWNIAYAIYMIKTHPELMDVPTQKGKRERKWIDCGCYSAEIGQFDSSLEECYAVENTEESELRP